MKKSQQAGSTRVSRRGILGAFAATAVTAAPAQAGIFGFLRGGGNVRRIRMYSARTGESIDMIYWADGRYIDDAVREISYFMHRNGSHNLNPTWIFTGLSLLSITAAPLFQNRLSSRNPTSCCRATAPRGPTRCCAAARAGWRANPCT